MKKITLAIASVVLATQANSSEHDDLVNENSDRGTLNLQYDDEIDSGEIPELINEYKPRPIVPPRPPRPNKPKWPRPLF